MNDWRVHWHWTGGAYGLIGMERDSYHEIIQPDGSWAPGEFPITANAGPLKPGKYAAHTLNANTRAIGIACDAMAFSKDYPFKWGPYPLTWEQIDGMLRRTAHYCRELNIPVSRETTLSHAEVEPTLGIKQRWKWDIAVLPGMNRVDDPVMIGDQLRARLREMMDEGQPSADIPAGQPEPILPREDIEAAKAAAQGLVTALDKLLK